MGADYKRGYNKGYATGCRRSDAANAAESARADQAAERAERAEKQQGLGHCEDCAAAAPGNPAVIHEANAQRKADVAARPRQRGWGPING